MTAYQAPAYQGPRLATVYRGPIQYKQLGQTFDQILGIPPAGGDIIRFIGHGIGSWFGLYIGTRGDMSTALRAIGWIVGSGMGLAALLDLVSLYKRAIGTHPPEE